MEELKLYIARDDDGTLWLHFNEAPEYNKELGGYTSYNAKPLPKEDFAEVTTENSPQEVVLTLKDKLDNKAMVKD